MLDIKLIRKDPEAVRANLARRENPEILKMFEELLKVDARWRKLTTEINHLRAKRNEISKKISNAKKGKKTAEVKKLMKEAAKIPNELKRLEVHIREVEERERMLLMRIPNLLHETVPFGKDDTDNVEIRRWGEPTKFDFQPKDHTTILKNLGLLDTEVAANVAGSGFYYLKGDLVMLDFALQRFAIEFLQKKGFVVVEPPFMVNRRVYEGMIGDPTDFAEASYKIEGEELWLIPTSEYSAGAMYIDHIFDADDLPVKICGVSPCFRREVGTHGKYTKGLFRVHQFNKVEQFVFCLPKDSWDMHEEIQRNSEELYQQLGLPYRVVNVCTGDIGAKAAKKYDTEVWMADGKFREVGSNSNVTDYQARRLNIRFREGPNKPVSGFVHMLNNTALATSRTIIAIVEKYQNADGTVTIPKVLRPFMGKDKLVKLK